MSGRMDNAAAAGPASQPLELVLAALTERGCEPKEARDGWRSACPSCGGSRRDKLSITCTSDGAVLLNCFASCSAGEIAAALNIQLRELFPSGETFRSEKKKSASSKAPRVYESPEQAAAGYLAQLQRDDATYRLTQLWQYHDAAGLHVCSIARFDKEGDKTYRPVTRVAGGWICRGLDGNRPLYRLPQLADEQTIWLFEGEKCADAGVSLGLCSTASMNGSGSASKSDWSPFAGKHITICADSGAPGQKYEREVIAILGTLQPPPNSVRVCRLGFERENLDIVNWLDERNGQSTESLIAELELLCESVWLETELKPATIKPRVIVSLDEAEVAREVVEHLGRLGWESPWVRSEHAEEAKVYQRSGRLTHLISRNDIDHSAVIGMREIPNCILRERITQCCELVTQKERNGTVIETPVSPPKWLIEAIAEREQFGLAIRPLAGVTYAPTIRPDGSIVQSPGYDAASGLYFHRTAEFPEVPDHPSRDDARQSAGQLYDVIVDFPFVSDADRSAWLAMVVSMVARAAIAGCVPLFAVTANTRGAGKSLLVDAAAIIAYGRPAARKSYTNDPDETRKMVTATLLEATQAALLDNVDVRLGGAALDAVLTSTTWNDRILGSSKTTGDLPAKTIWAATGNNLAFGADVARRVLPIRLMSPLEKPETRSGFAHANLTAWVANQRPRLATAALTLVRGYFAAGRPPQPGGEWGSYETWSDVVRSAIVWAGLADPLETREHADEQDETAELLALLVSGLEEADPDRVGLTTQEIERLVMHRPDETPTCPSLIEAASLICGPRFNVRVFGRRLGSFAGRVWQNRRIEKRSAGKNRKRWVVVGELGECGELSYPFASAQKDEVSNACARVIGEGKPTHQTHITHPVLECDLTDDAAWEDVP